MSQERFELLRNVSSLDYEMYKKRCLNNTLFSRHGEHGEWWVVSMSYDAHGGYIERTVLLKTEVSGETA